MARPDLWDDPEAAQTVGRKKNAALRELEMHDRIETALDEAHVRMMIARGLATAESFAKAGVHVPQDLQQEGAPN